MSKQVQIGEFNIVCSLQRQNDDGQKPALQFSVHQISVAPARVAKHFLLLDDSWL
jgi:hypothetical protein